MAKYVDIEKLIEELEKQDCDCEMTGIIYAMRENAAADVVEVVHGRWIWKHRHRGGFNRRTGVDENGETHTIFVDDRIELNEPYCSNCGKWNDGSNDFFCPNCGAKMDLEVQDADAITMKGVAMLNTMTAADVVPRSYLEALISDMKSFAKQWWTEDNGFPCRFCKHRHEGGACTSERRAASEEVCAGKFFEWRGIEEERR